VLPVVFLLSFLLLFVSAVFAHTINYALEKAPTDHVVWFYLKLGYRHILPDGFDHILFLVGLCLLSRKIKVIFWQRLLLRLHILSPWR